jgi:hypothetical protein
MDTPFLHNPFHDLESLFWLALWILLAYDQEQAAASDTDKLLSSCLKLYNELFNPAFPQRCLLVLIAAPTLRSSVHKKTARFHWLFSPLDFIATNFVDHFKSMRTTTQDYLRDAV